MSLAARNKIVPQMAEYDQVGDEWVPYLMRFDRGSRSFPSVSTDRWGIRNSVAKSGQAINTESLDRFAGKKLGVVIGSSAVWGVGATADRHTLPSCLNQRTDTVWLNLGGRAFNSTQEVILFLLHLPRQVDEIVLFSGVNTLVLSALSARPSRIYNAFFSQSLFEQSMAVGASGGHVGVRKAFRQLVREVQHKWFPSEGRTGERPVPAGVYNDVLACVERDLRAIKLLATGFGARVHYALQPLATWIQRPLAAEEQQIFKLLDDMGGDWRLLARYLGPIKDRYAADLARLCAAQGVPFVDMNTRPELGDGAWYFVDRVHLTDRGYATCASVLVSQLGL